MPPQPHSFDKATNLLVRALARDGLLVPSPPGLHPTARVFSKLKSPTKGALIVDMREINRLCVPRPRHFTLPSLETLLTSMSTAAAAQLPLNFCTLDISNHFWTCKVPPAFQHSVRIGVSGSVFSFPCLPFGWSHSPGIAQQHLATFLPTSLCPNVTCYQYLDDILLTSPDPNLLTAATQALCTHLSSHGWLISPKSTVTPTASIKWLGKQLCGATFTLSNTAPYICSMITIWLQLATSGYHRRRLHRLLGKLAWACRPGRSPGPFLSGAHLWLRHGPKTARFSPPHLLRALAEGIASSCAATYPLPTFTPGPLWFSDAASDGLGFWMGIWGAHLPLRIYPCPSWVTTQQSAELCAIVTAIRIAAYRHLPHLSLASDNMAALQSSASARASTALKPQHRLLRQLQHCLRWSRLPVTLYWIPSALNPADPISRFFSFPTVTAAAEQSSLIANHIMHHCRLPLLLVNTIVYRSS